MKNFLVLSRAPFFSGIIAPTLLATALCYNHTHQIAWIPFMITLVGLTAAHAGSNLFNDYFDYKTGADVLNTTRNKFSGGTPHLTKKWETPKKFVQLGIISFGTALLCGIFLMVKIDGGIGPIFFLTLVGFILAYFYTAPPFRLAYKGWGEISIFFAFGVLPVIAVYYIQTSELSLTAALVSLPLAFLITNIIWINQFPDYISDKKVNKFNLVVRLGLSKSRYIYYLMMLLTYTSIILAVGFELLNDWSLISLATIPLAVIASIQLHNNYNRPKKLEPAQGLTIITHLFTGLLLVIGLSIRA